MKSPNILQKFADFIAIESVSTDPVRKHQVQKAADFVEQELQHIGLTTRQATLPRAHPLIIGEYVVDTNAQTLGLYAHYDVQPEDPIQEWKSPPFNLTRKGGKLYARGISDDKCHIIQTIAALKELISQKKLVYNIVCIFEGEEEIGSLHFEKYAEKIKSTLKKIDAFYILDSGLFRDNVPQIEYGLRGLRAFELTIYTAKQDLHSGLYGNEVLNPAHVVADIISKLKDSYTNHVLIPGFYDDVRKIGPSEFALLKKITRTQKEELAETGVTKLVTQNSIPYSLISKIYPSLDVNGMYSGFIGEGVKTIIPAKATVKFTCRLVENQDPGKIRVLVSDYIKAIMPEGVTYTLTSNESFYPFYCSLDDPYIRHTAAVFSKIFGHDTLFNRSGGSIPAAEILQRLFNKPIIITGFTTPGGNFHAPNENLEEAAFFKGIEALEKLFSTNFT